MQTRKVAAERRPNARTAKWKFPVPPPHPLAPFGSKQQSRQRVDKLVEFVREEVLCSVDPAARIVVTSTEHAAAPSGTILDPESISFLPSPVTEAIVGERRESRSGRCRIRGMSPTRRTGLVISLCPCLIYDSGLRAVFSFQEGDVQSCLFPTFKGGIRVMYSRCDGDDDALLSGPLMKACRIIPIDETSVETADVLLSVAPPPRSDPVQQPMSPSSLPMQLPRWELPGLGLEYYGVLRQLRGDHPVSARIAAEYLRKCARLVDPLPASRPLAPPQTLRSAPSQGVLLPAVQERNSRMPRKPPRTTPALGQEDGRGGPSSVRPRPRTASTNVHDCNGAATRARVRAPDP